MMNSSFTVKNSAPTVKAFNQLRSLVGWNNADFNTTQNSINSSLFWISIFDETNLIATGRIVGDGAMYFYIQDVIVHPNYQTKGLGKIVMEEIENYLTQHCKKGSTIGLLSAQGKESFYEQFGYMLRDGKTLGHGMCKFI